MPLDLTPKVMPYYEQTNQINLGTQYKYQYAATITQTGTNPPVATILNNTLGTIVWERITDGQYQGTLTNAFPLNKTAPLAQQRDNNGTTLLFRTGNSTISLQTSIGGAYLDNLLTETYIQINIYA